jgi:hypothetical protein
MINQRINIEDDYETDEHFTVCVHSDNQDILSEFDIAYVESEVDAEAEAEGMQVHFADEFDVSIPITKNDFLWKE